MSIEIKSDILAKELNQGIVPLGVPKAYQYDAALVEAARAAVNQGLDDVAEAGATAKAAIETQKTASVNAVSAQEQASKADVNALGDKILAQMKHGYGYPFTAATAAAMADTTKIYVYTGSETGYTNGNWYYWNGTAWVSGGVYNATALETDKTLTVSGAAADAQVAGKGLIFWGDPPSDLTSCDNVTRNSVYFVSKNGPLPNIPDFPLNNPGWLVTHVVNENIKFQIAYPYASYNKIMYRQRGFPNTWTAWKEIIHGTDEAVFSKFNGDFPSSLESCDNVVTNSFYFIGDNFTPSNYAYGSSFGWLITYCSYPTTTQRVQLAFPWVNTNHSFKVRICQNNNWGEWFEISTENCIKNFGDAKNINSCDDIDKNGIYLVNYSTTPSIPDFPVNGPGWIQTIVNGNWRFQIIYPWTSNGKSYYRMKNASGWQNWKECGNGENITNNYTTNHYTNTYNVTAAPTITTDVNQYLAATGDSTDMTTAIETLLSTTGVCHLGPGDFYVSGVDVPYVATLDGCGNATRIYLMDSVTNGYAVKLNDSSTLKDVMLVGANANITLSSTVGTRHGILWEGNANGDNNDNPYRGTISNVSIKRFNGGGITCYNTGYDTQGLNVNNCHITNCNAAINVSYFSEFHRFTNIDATYNYYGCINNGGNNMFVNCNFSNNKMGMLMDNSQGQSPNNSHGSCVGCVFNHTDNNAGIGIKILDCDSGFTFTGCQIFFSQIYLEDSDGIVVADSNFGVGNCNITVINGGAVLFNGNMHQGQPTISITNNTKVHFENCYVRSTGAVVSAS